MNKQGVIGTVQNIMVLLDGLIILGSERHKLVQIEKMIEAVVQEVSKEEETKDSELEEMTNG